MKWCAWNASPGKAEAGGSLEVAEQLSSSKRSFKFSNRVVCEQNRTLEFKEANLGALNLSNPYIPILVSGAALRIFEKNPYAYSSDRYCIHKENSSLWIWVLVVY